MRMENNERRFIVNEEIIADVQHVLPRNFIVVEYTRAHTLLLNPDYFQRRIMRHIPDYLDRLDMQKQMGVALTLLYEGRVVACFGIAQILGGVGEAWMTRDADFRNYIRGVVPLAKRFFLIAPPVMQLKRVQMIIDSRNFKGIRFAEWLKFEHEGTLRSFGFGDHEMMARLYDQYNNKCFQRGKASEARPLHWHSASGSGEAACKTGKAAGRAPGRRSKAYWSSTESTANRRLANATFQRPRGRNAWA